MKAVRFEKFGGTDVLQVVEVPRPTPAAGQVLIKIKTAGINPGEASIRKGLLEHRWPTTLPCGEGTDLAGIIEEVGEGVANFKVGDEVIGSCQTRGSHAEYALADAVNVIPRPAKVPWEQAGALFVAGTTAQACINAVGLKAGDTVVVSGAAGGVGCIVVQLAKNIGAFVFGLASSANHQWLTDHGITPILYGDGQLERILTATGGKVDAFIDTFGHGYISLALELTVPRERINTIIDFEGAQQHGVKAEGSAKADTADVLAHLVGLIADGKLEIPIAKTYPLSQVREAFNDLEQRHTRGKIVLLP